MHSPILRDSGSAGPHYKLPAEKVKAVGVFDEFVILITIYPAGQRGVAGHGVVNKLGGSPALAHRLSTVLNQRDL